jgi:hypothetical protein
MSLATALKLCVGAALFMSFCFVDLCTKMCVKKTGGGLLDRILGLCTNSPVKASKIVMVYTVG